MSLSRNLVLSCAVLDFTKLWVGTKQIFGLCEAFGVEDTQRLFNEYCRVVTGALDTLTVDRLVKYFTDLAHGPNQTDLARLMRHSKLEWKSMLTM